MKDPPTQPPPAIENQADSDELVRLLLASTGEGISGIDLNGNCTLANPACLRLLGFERGAEVLGRNMHELVHRTRANGDSDPEEECQRRSAAMCGPRPKPQTSAARADHPPGVAVTRAASGERSELSWSALVAADGVDRRRSDVAAGRQPAMGRPLSRASLRSSRGQAQF